jgi:hypothetical protein
MAKVIDRAGIDRTGGNDMDAEVVDVARAELAGRGNKGNKVFHKLSMSSLPFAAGSYYAFDHRPWWFRMLWRLSNLLTVGISGLPHGPKSFCAEVTAKAIYWPLARGARLEKRFTRREVESMLQDACFEPIIFSSTEPFWCAVDFKAAGSAITASATGAAPRARLDNAG